MELSPLGLGLTPKIDRQDHSTAHVFPDHSLFFFVQRKKEMVKEYGRLHNLAKWWGTGKYCRQI